MRPRILGYLLKEVEPEELVNAIRTTVRGQAILRPSAALRLVRHVDCFDDDSLADLSTAELEVLRLIAGGPHHREMVDELVIASGPFALSGHIDKARTHSRWVPGSSPACASIAPFCRPRTAAADGALYEANGVT
jgi:hypothetical protein